MVQVQGSDSPYPSKLNVHSVHQTLTETSSEFEEGENND